MSRKKKPLRRKRVKKIHFINGDGGYVYGSDGLLHYVGK